jgi:hypothetical protein
MVLVILHVEVVTEVEVLTLCRRKLARKVLEGN